MSTERMSAARQAARIVLDWAMSISACSRPPTSMAICMRAGEGEARREGRSSVSMSVSQSKQDEMR